MKTLLLAMLALCFADQASATVHEVGPTDNWKQIMQALQPGDTLVMDGGVYGLTGFFSLSLHGTGSAPILIRAKDGEQPVIHFVDASQNIINISNTTFLTFDGIEFTGGSRGLRFMSGTSDITVRNCHVHDTGANAITANDSGVNYARFTFEHNEIDHTGGTGEAFYLGCNNNACQFHDSRIANNYIHDLNGPTVTQGDGIEIKQGSYANVVQDNVIHGTAYPGITLYDVAGNGALNLIERNLIWNSGDNGIQVTADAVVRNNIVLSAAASAFAANAVQGATPANLTIVNNTFIAPSGNGIKLNSVGGAITIANNAIYAPSGSAIIASGTLGGITSVANAGQGALTGVSAGFAATGNLASDFFAANLSGAPPQNLVPSGTLLVGAASAALQPADDFSTVARGASMDIGAYRANAAGNPGWPIQAGFKVNDAIFIDGFGR